MSIDKNEKSKCDIQRNRYVTCSVYIQSRLSTTRPVITLIGYKAVAGASDFSAARFFF